MTEKSFGAFFQTAIACIPGYGPVFTLASPLSVQFSDQHIDTFEHVYE